MKSKIFKSLASRPLSPATETACRMSSQRMGCFNLAESNNNW